MAFFDLPYTQHPQGTGPFQLYSGAASTARSTLTCSDHVRVILLARYGGLWLDNDVYLARDLTSLFRVGPFVGTNLPSLETSNSQLTERSTDLTGPDAVIFAGPADGATARKLVMTACEHIPMDPDAWRYKSLKPVNPSWIINDGLFKIVRLSAAGPADRAQCQRITHCGITSLPMVMLDSLSWADGIRGIEPCDVVSLDTLRVDFSHVFAWHSRLGQHPYEECMTADPATPARLARERALAALERADWRSPRALWD